MWWVCMGGLPEFRGKYVEVLVQGALHMQLPRTGESYSWQVQSVVHALL